MKRHEELALKFGRYLVLKDWEAAHALLSEELRSATSANGIEHAVRTMLAHGDEILAAEVVIEMENWPEKETDGGQT